MSVLGTQGQVFGYTIGFLGSQSTNPTPGSGVASIFGSAQVTLATTAALLAGEYVGVAIQGFGPAPSGVVYQQVGPLDPSVVNLGVGAAGPVYMSATGVLQRTVNGTAIGTCDANGNITLTLVNQAPSGAMASTVYGDGSDGTVTFDGVTTVLGMAPSTNVYTMTRDIQCANITVNAGITVNTASFRIRVAGVLLNNGTIQCQGGAGGAGSSGAGGTAGAIVAAGSLGAGTAGGAGGNSAAGSNGTNATAATGFPVVGNAAGGTGGAATNAGGTAGTTSVMAASVSAMFRSDPFQAMLAMGITFAGAFVVLSGGTGGGGGGAPASSGGGGGGAGGGVLAMATFSLINNGSINVNGGAGGAGGGTNAGGGAGGGGGILISVARIRAGTGTITAAGGAAGALLGTGTAGAAGSAGNVLLLAA